MAEHIGDREGQQFGDYRQTRFLGRGSFGDVYLGEHIHDHTLAAVKVLQARLTAEDLKEFINETSTIFRMQHPNIVQLLDFGIATDGTPFLVMNYAPNGTLRQLHPKGARLPLNLIVTYVKQIAAALQYAHDKKRIHRDVKPENILLGPHNEVLLSDFGIAVVAHSTRSLNMKNGGGTVPYMAPEQVQGKPRLASDQYALGIIVYEWLCGERPFNGTATEIAMQHMLTPPPPLREKVSTLSSEVEQVVMTALAKDAKDRFGSVQAFANALEQAFGAVPLLRAATPAPIAQPTQEPPLSSFASTRSASCDKDVELPVVSTPASVPVLAASVPNTPSTPSVPVPLNALGIAPSPPASTDTPSVTPKQHISRRTVMVGLAGLAAVGAVGGGIAILSHSQPSTHTQPAQNPTIGPPTPNPAINSSGAMFGYDLQHTRFNSDEHILSPTNVSRLVSYWTATTGGIIDSSPTVTNGVVYVGSEDGNLYAVQAATGTILWTASTGGYVESSPAVANGVIYVGSDDQKLYAVQAATGTILWTASTGGYVESSPAVAGGVVYVGSDDGKLYAFEAATGKTLWTATGNSSPAVANGVVYVNSDRLYAFEAATGKTLRATKGYNGISSPAVANGVVYVNSDRLYALEAATGKTLWTTSTAYTGSSPTVANGVVYFYVGSQNHKLYAFQAASGQPLWSAPTGGNFDTGNLITSSPAVANGVVYVGSRDSKLYAFHLP